MPAQAWVTLIVGILATIGVTATLRQRTSSENRAQAWQRIAWSLELTTSDDDAAAELGWTMYSTVSKSKLITPTERDVIRTVSEHAMRRALAQDPDTEDTEPQTDTTEDPR